MGDQNDQPSSPMEAGAAAYAGEWNRQMSANRIA
jgi:hypothetical protein